MVDLLKKEFLDIINNSIRRGDAPVWTSTPLVRVEDITDHTFDIDDPKDNKNTIKRKFGHGTASYVNGHSDNPYKLRFICFEEYLNQFVFDDGKGNTNKSLLKPHTHRADLIVYDTSDNHAWIIIHELSTGNVANKRNLGRIQLSKTIDLLCKSEYINRFIIFFVNKCCVLSACDERVLQTPKGIADAFINSYSILPEPLMFQFGAMKRLGFMGYETSKLVLV